MTAIAKVAQLLVEVSGGESRQAGKACGGNAFAIGAMTAQASHGGRVLPALREDFLAIGGMRRRPGQDQRSADRDATQRFDHGTLHFLVISLGLMGISTKSLGLSSGREQRLPDKKMAICPLIAPELS
jgi:hypothetical protein